MVLTSTEIYSRAKELICRIWVVPPVHPWYFQRHPGSAISFKGSRSYQTALSRFSTGHLRCMNFEGGKRSFPICPKCNIGPFSSQHILQCLGFSCEEAVASPLLFLDLVQIYGLMDLVQFHYTRWELVPPPPDLSASDEIEHYTSVLKGSL
ncbi:uncharacterized protein TNCV_1660761 [Trichonephila clavipes]|nr:uncharacterized protein TNCV_1660761 [Trichonephila clavipes]